MLIFFWHWRQHELHFLPHFFWLFKLQTVKTYEVTYVLGAEEYVEQIIKYQRIFGVTNNLHIIVTSPAESTDFTLQCLHENPVHTRTVYGETVQYLTWNAPKETVPGEVKPMA